MSKALWEIFVPTQDNNGKPFRTRYHRVWDNKVREISGGLTILKPATGQWISDDNELFKERMVPVRIMCTQEEIVKIAEETKTYYDQLAVMYYKITDEVVIHK